MDERVIDMTLGRTLLFVGIVVVGGLIFVLLADIKDSLQESSAKWRPKTAGTVVLILTGIMVIAVVVVLLVALATRVYAQSPPPLP